MFMSRKIKKPVEEEGERYRKWKKKYDAMYYSLYDEVITLYKEYCKLLNVDNIEISLDSITTDLLMHPHIQSLSLVNNELEFHSSFEYPKVNNFVPIKFLLLFLKYLEYKTLSLKYVNKTKKIS